MSEIKTEKKKRSRLLTWFRRGFFGTKKEMSIFEEEQIILIQEIHQVVPAHFDFHVSLFLLPEIE